MNAPKLSHELQLVLVDLVGIDRMLQLVEDLWNDSVDEMLDGEFATRTHPSRGTYNSGCRGPLCTRAVREGARGTGQRVSGSIQATNLILNEFTPIIKERISRIKPALEEQYRLELIAAIKDGN